MYVSSLNCSDGVFVILNVHKIKASQTCFYNPQGFDKVHIKDSIATVPSTY